MAPSGASGDCVNAAGSSCGEEGDPEFNLLPADEKRMLLKQRKRSAEKATTIKRRGNQMRERHWPLWMARVSFSPAARTPPPQPLMMMRRRLCVSGFAYVEMEAQTQCDASTSSPTSAALGAQMASNFNFHPQPWPTLFTRMCQSAHVAVSLIRNSLRPSTGINT